ncbi:TPA: restriction endonuclease subunit S, partial [Escherichia coli]|nr:restriction endonuclease subunit S [Escherichia coli]
MSEMSYLEKLLDGVEVEWKAVGDIAGYSTTKVDADKLDATSFVGVDNLLADKGGRIDATYQPNTARLTAYEPGDILLGNIRPYLKKVWMAENNGGCSGDVLAIRILADCKKIISPEYLYYALSSDSFFSYSMQHAKGAKMPRGSKDAILNYQIPIPCPSAPEKSLAIQSEIVRILDKFTALTAELTMRKKQYNYYRDQLLSFEQGEVEWKTLGEITTKIASGRNKTRDADGKFPVYGSTGLIGFIDKAAYSGDLLLVARVGAYAGLVNAVSGHFDVSDNTLIIHPSDSWNVRFAFHQLRHMNLNQYAVGAGQPLITDGLLKNLKVPF